MVLPLPLHVGHPQELKGEKANWKGEKAQIQEGLESAPVITVCRDGTAV